MTAQHPETNDVYSSGHVPVLLQRVTELLDPAEGVIVDGTLGAGGHSEYLLENFPNIAIIGVDRDPQALAGASRRLARFGDRFVTVHSRFDGVGDAIDETPGPVFERARRGLAGALFDLGVSSMQLDETDRGFAYRVDAPLDMRMDPTSGLTAADILNTYEHGQLARILKDYGDERFAGKIASAVLRERDKEPFTTSARLVELLYATIPAATRRTGGHPAKRTFQALRVEVNHELDALNNVIPVITSRLAVGGRAVFMSYQSLEDKIVKRQLAELTKSKTPAGLPMELPGTAPKFKLVTRGAEQATESEIEDNPRAAPVRVRAIERIAPDSNPGE